MRCNPLSRYNPKPSRVVSSIGRALIIAGWVILASALLVNARQVSLLAGSAPCTVCISQVYGGGGNTGATYNADFIELFNATGDTISLTGWSVAYASAGSNSWETISLDGHGIQPYSYRLIRLASGSKGDGASLPTSDLSGAINLAADTGKVGIRSPGSSQPDEFSDLLGYGGDASHYETQPAPAGSNTRSLRRLLGGCTDTYNNSTDFEKVAPTPRNSASPQNFCTPPTPTPTLTPTLEPPTDTPTPTPTEIATNTPEPTPTETSVPTDTPIPTPTETATNTPEPTPTETPISTETATPIPTDTPISTPTETATPIPTDAPIPTPTETATPIPTDTPISTPTETATPIPTDTPIPTPTETATTIPTDTPTPAPPSIRLSEIMPDPSAVPDAIGEFIELTNAGVAPVNLRGWRLTSGSRSHTIAADLWLNPGAYVVLTKGDATALADYVHSDYQFASLQLANSDGNVKLFAPDSLLPTDEIAWSSDGALRVHAGVSFERTGPATSDWSLATTPWRTTHTDKGSPGSAYGGAPTATPAATPPTTSSPAPITTATETATATPTETPTPAPTAPPAASPTATPTTGPVPLLRLSEIMADPLAVGDNVGEFIEVVNVDTQPVNLRGWLLIDGGGRSHVIAADLWLDPGTVRVLTRGGATALAGYAPSDYQYSSLQLANTSGSLALYFVDGVTLVDALAWGDGTSLSVQPGASFERISAAGTDWVVAATPWSTQHTDKGSPGAAFAAIPPTPTPTVATPPEMSPTATPITFPTPTPTAGPAPRLRLSEVMADPFAIADNAGEFIELTSLETQPVNLRDWTLIDGGGRRHTIAVDLWLDPGAYRVLTRGDAATLAGYVPSDYQFATLQLGNSGGALSLYPPGGADGAPVDALTWGNGAPLAVQPGASFERIDLLADAWTLATTPWNSAHTDKGSPGAAYSARRRPRQA